MWMETLFAVAAACTVVASLGAGYLTAHALVWFIWWWLQHKK
jgi:hypothetical protein